MLALACALGVWQLQRLAWKTALLADIDRAESGRAIPLAQDPPAFAKIRVEGEFLPGAYALYGADVADTPGPPPMGGPRMGARMIVALRRAGNEVPVLVDRGWVPAERAGDIAAPAGPVSVDAYVRRADRPGLFAPADDPARHRFFTLDPAAIGPSLGLARVAPFVLVALGPRLPGVYPQPAQELPRPANDHLSYAITWFVLALTLAIIFTIYCRKVLRP